MTTDEQVGSVFDADGRWPAPGDKTIAGYRAVDMPDHIDSVATLRMDWLRQRDTIGHLTQVNDVLAARYGLLLGEVQSLRHMVARRRLWFASQLVERLDRITARHDRRTS